LWARRSRFAYVYRTFFNRLVHVRAMQCPPRKEIITMIIIIIIIIIIITTKQQKHTKPPEVTCIFYSSQTRSHTHGKTCCHIIQWLEYTDIIYFGQLFIPTYLSGKVFLTVRMVYEPMLIRKQIIFDYFTTHDHTYKIIYRLYVEHKRLCRCSTQSNIIRSILRLKTRITFKNKICNYYTYYWLFLLNVVLFNNWKSNSSPLNAC
jgi:hypothetical protein